jgi:hypothetical protein
MMMAIALFFMGPSPDVLAQGTDCAAYTKRLSLYCSQIEKPARRKSDLTGAGDMTSPLGSGMAEANHRARVAQVEI